MTGGTAARETSPAFRPGVRDLAADGRFRELARRKGLDPDNRWVGGYVEYEWSRLRHYFGDGLLQPRPGARVLEFGCNVGASSVVLAALGMTVTAVDVDPGLVGIAHANAERHGLSERISFHHVPDTSRLPFADGAFDLVTCNSVLEYVPTGLLAPVLHEIDRVLVRGGTLLVTGTSNRLWIREVHSRAWLVNYLPLALDRLFPGLPRRGVFPWDLRRPFRAYREILAQDGCRAFVALKVRMGLGRAGARLMRAAGLGLGLFGVPLAWVMPNLAMVLRKP